MSVLSIMLAATVAGAPTPTAETSYQLMGQPFSYVVNGKDCKPRACTEYSKADKVFGTFTLSKPMGGDLKDAEISTTVLEYRFSDGHGVIASDNPTARKVTFVVSTDGKGGLTAYNITVEQTSSKPGASPKRVNAMTLIKAFPVQGEIAFSNVICLDEGAVPGETGKKTACRNNKVDDEASRAEHAPGALP